MIHDEICTCKFGTGMGKIIEAVRILSQTARERQEEYDKIRKELFNGVCEQHDRENMTDQELKELMAKSAQAHAEVLKHCDEELMRGVSITAVLRLHDGTAYSPGHACPVCGGEMVIEKIQMQEQYMMRLCHRCGTTIKTPFTNIEAHTPF